MELWQDEHWEETPDVYNINEVNIKPVILRNVPVIYPHDAIEKKLSGKVVIKVVINEKGFVIHADIYKGLHDGVTMSLDERGYNNILIKKSHLTSSLDMAALDAAKKTRFNPAFVKGKPVKSLAHIPFTFVAK